MGWDNFFSTEPEIDIIKNELLSNCKVHYYNRKGNVFYLAVSKKDHSDEIFGVVVLYDDIKCPTEKMFKVIYETMGPCYYDANKELLELLTPTENKLANEWRKTCLKIIEINKNVKKGTHVVFKENIEFVNGKSGNRFVYKGGNVFSTPGLDWDLYYISHWKTREFKILKEKK